MKKNKKTYEKLIVSKIKGLNNLQIKNLRKQNNCKHQWAQWASGFKCVKCEYYTDYDKNLNSMIEKIIPIS